MSKTSNKIGLIAAISILVGSVVGIGIFFKNGSVGKSTGFDGWMLVSAWIVGGVISSAAAVSYSEIGRLKVGQLVGLSSWSNMAMGKKFGYLVAITFPTVNFGVNIVAIAYFASDFFWNVVGAKFSAFQGILVNLVCSLGLIATLLSIKRVSIKTTGLIQSVTTVIKLIPLLVGVVIGFIVKAVGSSEITNSFVEGPWVEYSGFTRFLNIFKSLPAVLFAYDAFLNLASMTDRVKDGEKRVPWIIVVGMILIAILYTLVGVSSAATGKTNIGDMVGLVTTNQTLKNIFNKIVMALITVSAIGVTNGMIAVFNRSLQNMYNAGVIFGAQKLKARYGENGALFYIIGFGMFYFLILSITSLSIRSDIIIDGFSNYPTQIFMIIYSVVIAGYTLKRSTLGAKPINNKLFYTTSVVAVIGIIVGSIMFLISQVSDIIYNDYSTIGWGASYSNDYKLPTWVPVFLLLVFVVFMLFVCFLNHFLIKKYEGRDSIEVVAKA